jgi:hypothetical protein
MSRSVKALGTSILAACLFLFAVVQFVQPLRTIGLNYRPIVAASHYKFTRHISEEVNNGTADRQARLPEPGRIIQFSASEPKAPAIHEVRYEALWPSWAGRTHRQVEPSGSDDH